MNYGIRAFCLAATLVGATSSAHAVVTIDQSSFDAAPVTDYGYTGMVPTGFPVHQTHLQTFTVGVTGTLTQLDVKVANYAGSGAMSFLLFNNGWLGEGVASGSYGNVLFSSNFTNSTSDQDFRTVSFDMAAAGIAVTSGQVLSFSVRSAEAYGVINSVKIARTGVDYEGGKGYIASNIGLRYLDYGTADLQFRTLVDAPAVDPIGAVPEPATWAMFIGGFGLVGASMRRRQRVGVRFA